MAQVKVPRLDPTYGLLAACIIGLAAPCGMGCAPRVGRSDNGRLSPPGVEGQQVAEELSAETVANQDLWGSTIDLYDVGRIERYVYGKVRAGDVTGMLQLVQRADLYGDRKWYPVFAHHFAWLMASCRCRPVVLDSPLRGADEAVAAMKTLATSYLGGPGAEVGREVRVLAAMAIRSDDPRQATRVLLAEYAVITVAAQDLPADLCATPCGGALAELGHSLPKEVTTIDDVRRLLPLGSGVYLSDEESRSDEVVARLAAVADAFNQRLRDLLQAKDEKGLDVLHSTDERARLMGRLYHEVTPKPIDVLFERE